jgi:hypothetical protein
MRVAAVALLLPLALATPINQHSAATDNDAESILAPLSASDNAEVIDDSYVVVMKKDIKPEQLAMHLAVVDQWHALDVSGTDRSPYHTTPPPTGWRDGP